MHHTTPPDTCSSLSAAIESIAGNGLDGLHAAAIALQRPDGHIQLEFAAEDAINLQPPRPSNARPDQLQSLPDPSSKSFTVDGDTDELLLIPPLMNICILIVGTRGDVQPFLAIALRLQEDGHRVRLATHAVYRDFVMSHGVEFYPLGGDPKELAAYMVKTGGNLIPMKIKTLTEDVPRNMQMINEIVFSTWPAVSEPDPDGEGPDVPGPPFRAQAIIANPVSYGHIHVAERLGVPLHIMFPNHGYLPWHSHIHYRIWRTLKRNYLSYKLVDLIMWQGTEGVINEFRTEVLKLHPIRNGDSGSELLLDLNIPHSFMWSPQLVPKPSDWGDLYDVIGTVTLKGPASEYSPSPELEAFLGNDGGPIFVGFGSMVLADPLATTKMIIEAATHAKMRVLIQSSWSDMAGDIDIPSNVFFIGNCPHDWLMPRVSAVVHHGGAGTTAAGLLAGKPTFIVPFFGDQPFWGQAVVSARVGVPPCPIAQLTTEILHNAFVELANPDLRKRAEAMRDLMLREDGAGEAVRRFYHHLPTQDMWCDLDHQRIAMQWSVHDRIKLCDRCAFIVRERPENQKKKFVRYHCVDYSARGPSSLLTGVATGAIVFAHELTGGLTGVLLQPAKGLINGGVVGAVKGAVADWKTCTVKSLALSFRDLLKPELRDRAKTLSATFDREQPVNTAVKAFYANLPLEAMRCDVDPSKLARVFDPPHTLKLSLPVYVAIRDKTKVFVPYKPLRFGGSLPPTFSILGNPVNVSRQAKPFRQVDAVRQTLDLLDDNGHRLSSRTLSCTSIVSNPGSLVATPEQIEMFWSSEEEEASARKATTVAYERLVKKPQRTTKREAVMRFFKFRKSTQRREAEQLTIVE
ncbi:Hsp70-binding protein 1 [Phytophthora nicotianae]|uniref:Hsp70-binding protein 1 n=1 Tax=Phytophthora nicotianae TaxID=4792 RepID=A0A0W8DHQ1_PHYNI|nr:Hsp70-binding protein 1 [Phytophthora nicotianae]